jgi:transcriptional regulator with XRE-family HTH domain/type IV secretory pathway TrbD component
MREPVDRASFGELLRRYRLEANLTQAALAVRAHLSVQAIGMLERGARRTPRRDTVVRLTGALRLNATRAEMLMAASATDEADPIAAMTDAIVADTHETHRAPAPTVNAVSPRTHGSHSYRDTARPARRRPWLILRLAGILALVMVVSIDGEWQQSIVQPAIHGPSPAPTAVTTSAHAEHPLPCRLPLDLGGHGAFLDVSDQPLHPGISETWFDQAGGRPRLPDGEEPVHVTYDSVVGNWLPVAPAWMAPDGRSYAYSDGEGALHVADAATGRERILHSDHAWVLLSFQPEGLYVAQMMAMGTAPAGLWLVSPATGSVRQLREDGPWQYVGGRAAWAVELRAPVPKPPVWAKQGDGPFGNTLVRLDLATGATTTAYRIRDDLINLVGVDAQGDAVAESLRSPVSPLIIVGAAGRQLSVGQGSWANAVADGRRTWFAESDGASIWLQDVSGIREVAFTGPTAFSVAGACD